MDQDEALDFGLFRAQPEKNPVKLWDSAPGYDETFGQAEPTVTPYLLEGQSNGCVIVLPGGGYAVKAAHEAEPIALAMNALGFSAFIVDYRVEPYRFPLPQADASRAVKHVRCHAGQYGIDPEKIAILGFSAGGHLAACTGVFWDKGDAASADPVERVSSRPDAMILCYPVIQLFGGLQHEGSVENLLGENASDEASRAARSPNLHVSAETAPAFLWHTADDEAVPVGNSIEMFSALRKKGVFSELHVFPHGNHGLGLASVDPQVSKWVELCGGFLRSIGF
jgi:acetyl esterase/lipase